MVLSSNRTLTITTTFTNSSHRMRVYMVKTLPDIMVDYPWHQWDKIEEQARYLQTHYSKQIINRKICTWEYNCTCIVMTYELDKQHSHQARIRKGYNLDSTLFKYPIHRPTIMGLNPKSYGFL